MPLTQHLNIDNSLDSAIKTGSIKKPSAEFYRKLMKKVEWKELLAEAYLIAPVEKLKNDEDGITPYLQCGCEYPHHAIQNDKLVLSIPRLKKAFYEAVKYGSWAYHGEARRHLERHMADLEGTIDFHAVFTSDFDGVYEYIEERLRSWCSRASETYIIEMTNDLFEKVKRERATMDAEAWFNDRVNRAFFDSSYNLALAEYEIIHYFANRDLRYEELRLTQEEALVVHETLKERFSYGAAHFFMEGWQNFNQS